MDGCRQTCKCVYIDGLIWAELHKCLYVHTYTYMHTECNYLAICLSIKEDTSDHRCEKNRYRAAK